MSEAWNQSIFLGDILLLDSTAVVVSMTVAGPTVYSANVTYAPGTWFASPLHWLQHIVYTWNQSMPGAAGAMTAGIESDPTSANHGKLYVNPDTGWGTITALTFTIPNNWVDLGLSSGSWALGASPPLTYTPNAVPSMFGPLWPLASMDRTVEVLSGYTARATNGTAYSVAGATQEMLTLGVNIDRSDYTEVHAWRDLFDTHWTRGRSVVFYLDRLDLPAEWYTYLDGGEPLVLTNQQKSLDFSRMIDYTESQDKTSANFGIRVSGYLAGEIL